MWEKGGIIYALHRSIQRTHHVHVQWLCKTVIHYAAINAWRDRSRRRQKEISLEYLTEEKFYPLGTTDEYFEAPHEEHPITICGQAVILTNGKLAAVLLSLPQKNREIIFPYFFKNGLTMGEIEMTKMISCFDENVDRDIKKLIRDFKDFQTNAIAKLKKYL